MSIYEVIGFNVPIIAYSIIHQPLNTTTSKEYIKNLHELRATILSETEKIQSIWKNHLLELSTKTVQTSRGNLSQFLSTPLQSDTSEIQKIIKDQFEQTAEQLLPHVPFGIIGGYDGKFILDAVQNEIPKSHLANTKLSLHEFGFKVTKNSPPIFESLYLFQSSMNLDVIENMIRSRMGIYNSPHGNKINLSNQMSCAIYNLFLLEGSIHTEKDKFELQIGLDKGSKPYYEFHIDVEGFFNTFLKEIHDVNICIWQRKLGLGRGKEYIFRVRLKDRLTLRNTINMLQKFSKMKNLFAKALFSSNWLVKEIV